ncbi:MAG: AmmeMemoRadiSam system protein B [Armatimonadetes bacterium]|nr:AmmeMemoRadiSam system protein B [Armatimonadota bacterium]
MAAVRPPAVAGQFYEGRQAALQSSIEDCFKHPLGPGSVPTLNLAGPGEIQAVVSPHAGYMFSGPAAAHGYHALAADGLPEAVIMLGPSHYTADRVGAVSMAEAWRTPLGEAKVDRALGQSLVDASPLLEADETPHRSEHSLEVQVPFLQYIFGESMPGIVPICIRAHVMEGIDAVIEGARNLGETIAEVVGSRRVVVVASTDLSHQVPHEVAAREDRRALDAIEAGEPERLLRTVYERGISMCGPVPVAIALNWSAVRGAQHAEQLKYYTSGDIIGDRHAVVGYASLVVRRPGGQGR